MASDIEDWRPEGFGTRKRLSCRTWDDRELGYYVYWMRSLPGERSGLTYRKRPLTNWWHLVGDFDAARRKSISLVE